MSSSYSTFNSDFSRRLLRPILAGLAFLYLCSCSDAKDASSTTAPKPGTPLSEITFVAFDTETTGLDAKKGRIVEIGAVKYRDGVILQEGKWLINPRRWIPYWAQEVHGITPDMVKDSPTFAEAYPEFAKFIKGSVLLAHNASFDIRFMNAEMKRNDIIPPENPVIDSLPLFRNWYPEAESHSLEPLTAYVGVEQGVYHRATDDSRYIVLIVKKWLNKNKADLTFGDFLKAGGGMKYFSSQD